MPDCSWCNEHNCPATEANVSGKNRWFFGKSKGKLIEEINTKCARICGECAREVQQKIDRSGSVKSKSWLGTPTSFHRELSQPELNGLTNLKVKYDYLSEVSDVRKSQDKKPYEKIIETKELLKNQLKTLHDAQWDKDDELEIQSDPNDPRVYIKVSETYQQIRSVLPMLDSYLRGDNFITFIVCAATKEEGRYRIDKNIEGIDRVKAALEAGIITPVEPDQLENVYKLNDDILDKLSWYAELWKKYITSQDPDSPPNPAGPISPGSCETLRDFGSY